MAKLNFYLKESLSKNDTLIFLFISFSGKRLKFSTCKSIKPIHWNPRQQLVKPSFKGNIEFNGQLIDLKHKVEKEFEKILEEDNFVSLDNIRQRIKKIVEGKKLKFEHDFMEAMDLYIQEKMTECKPLTIKKFNSLKNLLIRFEEEKKYKVTFDRINKKFDIEFKSFLINDLGQVNNTVEKYYSTLKEFLKWSLKNKFHNTTTFQDFEAKRDKTDFVYLTDIELLRLYNLDLTDKLRLAKTRDLFCFACFTGQRFSDVNNLKRSDIKDNTWHLYQVKGNKSEKVKVILPDFALRILEKYTDQVDPLPFITNQKANDYLKELCELAEINEPISIVKYKGKERVEINEPKYNFISFHTARRTFVTLSLEKGMRPEVTMQQTGHSDFKTMKKYLKIVDNVHENEIKKAWNSGNNDSN